MKKAVGSNRLCDRPGFGGILRSYDDVVRAYQSCDRRCGRKVLAAYRGLPSLRRAVEEASRARIPGDGKHPHQYRAQVATLNAVQRCLLGALTEIQACASFDGLYNLIYRETRHIRGVGELFVYDTAHRIGAYLGLSPKRVYLHRGTRRGAVAIGLEAGQPTLEMAELPSAFRKLKPDEVEDCLCIYEADLRHIGRSGRNR